MLHFWHISWLNNLKLTFQFNGKARILLILCYKYMNKRLKGMNCIHNVLTTCSKPSSSHNVWTKGHTWEQTLTHDRSDWNTCTKSRRLQGPNNYYTLWTLQGWRYCRAEGYCKSDEKFINVKSYQKCKILLRWHYQSITLSVTQLSAAVFRYSTNAADTTGNQN